MEIWVLVLAVALRNVVVKYNGGMFVVLFNHTSCLLCMAVVSMLDTE